MDLFRRDLPMLVRTIDGFSCRFCGALLSGTTTVLAILVKPVLDDVFVQRDTTKLFFFPVVILLVNCQWCPPIRPPISCSRLVSASSATCGIPSFGT